jgi:hypothetical protein
MQYAAQRYTSLTRRSLLAPLVALLVGAAAAVGGYALIDDESTVVQAPDKVVFVDTPGPGEGVRGIDDMTTPPVSVQPQTVVPYLSHGLGLQSGEAKHEGSTAAAIGAGSDSQSGEGEAKHEGSTAAAIGAGWDSQDADTANRTDPHGPAQFLRHAP